MLESVCSQHVLYAGSEFAYLCGDKKWESTVMNQRGTETAIKAD